MKTDENNLVFLKISDDLHLSAEISGVPLAILAAALLFSVALVRWWLSKCGNEVIVDSAEFGIGDSKIILKPSRADRQIAYSIWVELSTRKIGLEIDTENDVLFEVYESWYSFFGVTRELIKSIPAEKLGNKTTADIVSLSIRVLNEGLRPHLTRWQARFRHWYEREINKDASISPQDVQKEYREYETLISELLEVNARLIKYRSKMYEILSGKSELAEPKVD